MQFLISKGASVALDIIAQYVPRARGGRTKGTKIEGFYKEIAYITTPLRNIILCDAATS